MITTKDLDEICKQIIKEDLNEGDIETLMAEVTELIDSSWETANGLRARLLEAAAEIREANPSSGTSTPTQSSSSDPFSWHFQETLAKEIANLKAGAEARPVSKNLNDFGFAKIPIPNFQGNVKDFTKWRSQVEDYLNETASKSTEKQAVQLLDRLTPKDIDVSRCLTLKEAWEKLTGEYGSPVHIARLLMKYFSEFKLTKLNEESNLVQLLNAFDKLRSDLITNPQ